MGYMQMVIRKNKVHGNQSRWLTEVKIGGNDAWYMLGHVFWDEKFSKRFTEILEQSYNVWILSINSGRHIYRTHTRA